MRRFRFMILLAMISLLTGCSLASQVEDQAYVLVMGLDRKADGQLEMTVQIPKISGGAGESTSGGGGSENYMQLSLTANDFEGALEKLDWASPRNVNLAQMKLIVFSRELAEEESGGELIANIAQTERLFTATKVAVCEGSAKEFVSAIKPYIGTRISTDIEAMFDHYNDHGFVPESSLADLYYQTESVYSDPMVTYALLDQKAAQEQKKQQAQPVSAFTKAVQEVSDSLESDIPTRYLGAALFSDGRMKGVLNGNQTILANLLRNELDSFRYESGGQSLEFVPTRPVHISVDTAAIPVKITVKIALSFAAQEKIPDESRLRDQLISDLNDVFELTRRTGVEPFGFAERAARNFLTISQWDDFDWESKYRDAEIEIMLRFAQSDA